MSMFKKIPVTYQVQKYFSRVDQQDIDDTMSTKEPELTSSAVMVKYIHFTSSQETNTQE